MLLTMESEKWNEMQVSILMENARKGLAYKTGSPAIDEFERRYAARGE